MSNIVVSQNSECLFEVAKLYADRCDFKTAIQFYKQSKDLFLSAKNHEGFLKCLNGMLRIYAEMEDQDAINDLKELLQNLVLKEKIELDARTYYTLGLCASYRGQNKTALEFLEKSLAVALANDDKENICYAINGIAIVYASLKRYEDALKEIYNLQVFFQVLPFSSLKLTSQILSGHILREMGHYDKALEVFWDSYEELREEKNLYTFICLLYALGVTYQDSGNTELAKMYLMLAKKSADPISLKYSARKIDERLSKLNEVDGADYDLVFDSVNKLITEKKKGKVDFKNQFILLDLLKIFIRSPGEVYSKEMIVQKIWKQDYDPSVHDNKLYVTIKRLRRMIEPDFDKPRYIFRAKNGYYLNKSTRVLMEK